MVVRALQDAVEHTVITVDGRREPQEAKALRNAMRLGTKLSPNECRQILDLETCYPGISRSLISWYQFTTETLQMKNLGSEIAKHVEIGENQYAFSGACGIMGGVPLMCPEHIAKKLVLSAIKFGVQQTVDEFYKKTVEQTISFEAATLVAGITVTEEIPLCEGTKIIPADDKHKYLLPFDLRQRFDDIMMHPNVRHLAIIISEHTGQPRFKIVEQGYAEGFRNLEDFKYTNHDHQGERLEEETTGILSVLTDSPVVGTNEWINTGPYEPYHYQPGSVGSASYLDIRIPYQSVEIKRNNIEDFQETMQSLSSNPYVKKKAIDSC